MVHPLRQRPGVLGATGAWHPHLDLRTRWDRDDADGAFPDLDHGWQLTRQRPNLPWRKVAHADRARVALGIQPLERAPRILPRALASIAGRPHEASGVVDQHEVDLVDAQRAQVDALRDRDVERARRSSSDSTVESDDRART